MDEMGGRGYRHGNFDCRAASLQFGNLEAHPEPDEIPQSDPRPAGLRAALVTAAGGLSTREGLRAGYRDHYLGSMIQRRLFNVRRV